MPVVAFTTGSLGDILATAGIVVQISQTLLQSSSSCKQYRDVIDELKALHRVLLLAQDATCQQHSHLPLSQSLVDSVKTEVRDCQLMMGSFLDNIRRYRKPLSKTGIQGLWGQVWWAIWEQDELEGLRKSIATRVQRIHLLLSSFNAFSITNVSQEIRDGNLAINKVAAQLYTSNPMFREMDDMTWVVDIDILSERIEMDPSDAGSWHQMARTYMVGQNYSRAYESFQQAVYRDGRNPVFWCDISRLYIKINQWTDALDAASRSIRINPYFPETWTCLGQLYDSVHQYQDSLDAYQRVLELDPNNHIAHARVRKLRIQVQVNCHPSEFGMERGGSMDDETIDNSSPISRREGEINDGGLSGDDETDEDFSSGSEWEDITDDASGNDEADGDFSSASEKEENIGVSGEGPEEEEGQAKVTGQAQ